jgi:uncharacterized protein YaeQ
METIILRRGDADEPEDIPLNDSGDVYLWVELSIPNDNDRISEWWVRDPPKGNVFTPYSNNSHSHPPLEAKRLGWYQLPNRD